MAQGISGWRRDAWNDAPAQNGGAPSGAGSGPVHEAWFEDPQPPLPQALPRTALPAVVAPPSGQPGRDAQIRANLDAFRLAMNAPYRTPEGLAWPGTAFRMSAPNSSQEAIIATNAAALSKAIASRHLSRVESNDVRYGRGSPESIHAVTQALIDQGRLPPPSAGDLDARVRIMMFNHGIGVDCAGYVQQAYLRVMRVGASAAGFKSRANEDLSNLGARGFTRVSNLASVQPGDVVALGPPNDPPSEVGQPGHRVIVYDQHLASAADLEELQAKGSAGAAMVRSGPVRVFQVDSSWGCGGNALLGGVRRETWWYSETSGTWGWSRTGAEGPGSLLTARTPQAHPFGAPFGIFRGNPGR